MRMRSAIQAFSSVVSLYLVLSIGLANQGWASEASLAQSPAATLVSNVAEDLEAALQQAREADRLEDERHLDSIIDQHILPHLDVNGLAKKISGKHWSTIQDQGLDDAMVQAVIAALKRTYRVALSAYSGEKINVAAAKEYDSYSLVRVLVKTTGNEHKLDFAVRPIDGDWKVFDVSVDGIVFSKTLYTSLKDQFAEQPVTRVISKLQGS